MYGVLIRTSGCSPVSLQLVTGMRTKTAEAFEFLFQGLQSRSVFRSEPIGDLRAESLR